MIARLLLLFLATCVAFGEGADISIGLGPQPASTATSSDTKKVNGTTLGTTAVTAGTALIGTGSTIASVALAKDATIDGSGNVTLSNNSTARGDLGLGSVATLTAAGASGAATLDANSLLTFTQLPTARRLVASDCSAHAVSTGTAETVLKTFSFTAANLPTLAANSNITVKTLWTMTNSANSKTLKVRLGAAGAGTGGTIIRSPTAFTASAIVAFDVVIFVRSTNSEVALTSSATAHEGASAGSLVTAAIDLTANWEIVLSGTTASSGETIQLEAASVVIETP